MHRATRILGTLMLAASTAYAGQVSGVTPATGGSSALAASNEGPSVTGAASDTARKLSEADVKSAAEANKLLDEAKGKLAPGSGENAPIVVEPEKSAAGEGTPIREGQVSISDNGTVEIHVVD